eukprot:7121737-Alexandrium_andersonii.AAC.1
MAPGRRAIVAGLRSHARSSHGGRGLDTRSAAPIEQGRRRRRVGTQGVHISVPGRRARAACRAWCARGA